MTVEEAWAAGFLEGEGSFYATRGRFVVKASQKERECLERLQQLLGGSMNPDRCERENSLATGPVWHWFFTGPKAVEFTLRILPLLSARRRVQIETAFSKTGLGAPHGGSEVWPEQLALVEGGSR